MSTAETYPLQAGSYQGVARRPETSTYGRLYTPLERARSSLIYGLKSSYVVRNNRDRLDSVPEEVPLDLDRFCYFFETNINGPGFEVIVDTLSGVLRKVKIRRSLGIVGSGGDVAVRLQIDDIFPVPEDNRDPVVAQLRSWFGYEKFTMHDSSCMENLYKVDLGSGMPEDEVGQAMAVLRVAESAVRSIGSGEMLVNCKAAQALGYRES